MTIFVVTKIIRDEQYFRVLGIFNSLENAINKAESHFKKYDSRTEDKISFYKEISEPQRNICSHDDEDIIYCKTIWYKNNNFNIIFKIEEFQIE